MRFGLGLVVLVLTLKDTGTNAQQNILGMLFNDGGSNDGGSRCQPFEVWNWVHGCVRGDPDSCRSYQYWDTTQGKCIKSPCFRAKYFDQRTNTCIRAPKCPKGYYYEDESNQCKKCSQSSYISDRYGLNCIPEPYPDY